MKVWYSVENGGDGSAYPRFFDTSELAEWHQENQDEGWGEICTGSLEINGDNIIVPEAQTKEGFLVYLIEYESENIKDYIDKFFDGEAPVFTVKNDGIRDRYYGVYLQGKRVGESFAYPEEAPTDEGAVREEKKIKNVLR